MNFNKFKLDARTLTSMSVLLLFSLIAGASSEGLLTIVIVVAIIFVVMIIITIGNACMKNSSLKEFESSMTDFTISKRKKIGDDSILFYDEKKSKVRVVSINTNECIKSDIDNIKLTALEIVNYSFYVFGNESDHSSIFAKPLQDKTLTKKIKNFVPTNYVIGAIKSYFAIDKTNETFLAINDFDDFKIGKFKDIIKVEYVENGKSISSKSSMRTLGGAAIGGVLAGGAGMVVGGLSGKSTDHKEINGIAVKILLRDVDCPEYTLKLYMGVLKTKEDPSLYQEIKESAIKIVDLISVVIDQVDEGKTPLINSEPTKNSNIVDELTKLANLKAQGLLTEEEFSYLKNKLISK